MACLKIFSGDLPELTNEIIKYFHDDYITLHSCILVNRLWCRLAIPLLWENPFSIHFIQHLDTSNIISSIESWGAAVRTSTTQISNLIKFIYRSLFQIFIENEVNLHSLEVVSSSSQENTKFIPQIINITKPFKLKSLILNEILQIESLLLLIQKFGNNIEDFGFKIGINVSQQLLQLLESVVIYCSKIKILYLPSGLNSQNINSLINLIENIKQNLNYLLIDTNDNHLSSIILQNLGQILPFKLEYLYLSLITNRSDLEAFLKNSQNTFIKILVIKNTTKYESEDIFPYIEEYIIKKKRIKYLAILQTFLTSFLTAPRKNLFDLKDKVDYYKLYDIQVLDCYSSSINIEKFIL
uniref:F-box domain-containing protein n=1 Tax=Rhizophagus irregularis (strain DAOM 181602 / DAOM 197198 / MUCL 43194) TaxID=747089 RepID=U9UPC9_RHIID